MIARLKELEILGAEIDGETHVDIMLISLLEFFKVFHFNYFMSRGFLFLSGIPEGTANSTGDHWLSVTLTRGGERFFIFCKKNYKKKRLLNQRVSV